MDILEILGLSGIIPVIVIDDEKDAVPTAKALLEGGIGVLEITMRTPAGVKAIAAVRSALPEMVVGAGTVLSMQQLEAAMEAGAQFIVSPSYNEEIVEYCLQKQIPITPGCVTPTEIERALAKGFRVLKFFPASVYGGVSALQALNGPYPMVSFIPTGGINEGNLKDYVDKPYIYAVGGGWLASKGDMAAGNFAKITATAHRAVNILLGLELAHVGINGSDNADAMSTAEKFGNLLGQEVVPGNSSVFAGKGIEVNMAMGIGKNGHIAISTCNIQRAVYYLQKRGFKFDMSTKKERGGRMIAIYTEDEIGGFGVHLLQR